MPEEQGTARVRNAQDFWVYLDEFQPGSREGVRARLSPEVLGLLEHSARTAWIPIAADGQFVDAIVAELGEKRAEDCWRTYTARFVQSGLLKAVFEGAVRLFGLTVGSMAKFAPKGWIQSYRGVGEMKVKMEGTNRAIVTVEGLHDEFLCRDGYFIMLRGIFRGIHDLADAEDRMEFSVDREGRCVTAVFVWS